MTQAADVDLRALAADLAAASGQPFQQVCAGLVMDAANQVQTFAKAYAPVKTGDLQNSIMVEATGLEATITAASDHAAFVEFGTGIRGEFPGTPTTIVAKPGKVLSWIGRDGKRHFAKKVVNPGMAPRPFMRPAVERLALPLANSIADNAVIFITKGPNAPETLQNAPATGP
jgi:HK97 gp10 family phage protein